MVEAQPTENMAIDPPLGESDTPLMGNPILTRGATKRRRFSSASSSRSPSASPNRAWQVGLPVAAVVLIAAGGAFYFAARAHQGHPLMATPVPAPAAAPPAEPAPVVASSEPRAAAPIAPTAVAPPPEAAPPAAAPRRERVARLARAERSEPRSVRHTAARRAPAAEESGADVSATAPAAAPSPPPVITPPPATPQ